MYPPERDRLGPGALLVLRRKRQGKMDAHPEAEDTDLDIVNFATLRAKCHNIANI